MILKKLFLDWAEVNQFPALALLKGVSNSKSLSLSAGMIYALDWAYDNLFPLFPELRYLEVQFGEAG